MNPMELLEKPYPSLGIPMKPRSMVLFLFSSCRIENAYVPSGRSEKETVTLPFFAGTHSQAYICSSFMKDASLL